MFFDDYYTCSPILTDFIQFIKKCYILLYEIQNKLKYSFILWNTFIGRIASSKLTGKFYVRQIQYTWMFSFCHCEMTTQWSQLLSAREETSIKFRRKSGWKKLPPSSAGKPVIQISCDRVIFPWWRKTRQVSLFLDLSNIRFTIQIFTDCLCYLKEQFK